MKPNSTIHSAMLALLTTAIFPLAHADTFGTGANTFTIDFTPIGDPGNVADNTGLPKPAGAVAYNYAIGTYEVSRDMVDKARADGNLGIFLNDLSAHGGNDPNKPATGLTWNRAARFVNYLNVSHGYSPAYKFALQPGDAGYDNNQSNQPILLWQAGDAGFDPNNRFRNSLAHYVLPSYDEWYKAAYYNPANGTYVDYPTGSDTIPTAVPSGTAAGTAVFDQPLAQGPSFITEAGGSSRYGTVGQGGNANEWTETAFDGTNDDASVDARIYRGGSWPGPSIFMSAVWPFTSLPAVGHLDLGFRVALVPEPSGWALLWLAPGVAWLIWRRRVAH